jgi:hypothetical protein
MPHRSLIPRKCKDFLKNATDTSGQLFVTPAMSAEEQSSLRDSLLAVIGDLDDEEKRALEQADGLVLRVAMRTAASVARALRPEDVAHRPIAARKAERDVLEVAARELQLLVLHTASVPHALDGRLPLCIETGCGVVGIEVKSGLQTIASDEVEKFRSDVAHSRFKVAIFVSLRAPIAKIPKGLHIQHELSLGGLVPALFVSPLASAAEQNMTQLLRGVLSVACVLGRMEHARDAGRVGTACAAFACLSDTLGEEAEAIGLTRKRLRDEDEVARRRVERATDAMLGIQTRLCTAANNAALRASAAANPLT